METKNLACSLEYCLLMHLTLVAVLCNVSPPLVKTAAGIAILAQLVYALNLPV
jgi:hypothetical protein